MLAFIVDCADVDLDVDVEVDVDIEARRDSMSVELDSGYVSEAEPEPKCDDSLCIER